MDTATTANPVNSAHPAVLDLAAAVAAELRLPASGAAAVLRLLDEGCTVPFIARYRKEATGSLDEVQIRDVQERAKYLKDLDERRASILANLREQGVLTPELEAQVRSVTTKAALEDLYLPFRPKRRTRAIVAREKGLDPLAQRILAQPLEGDPKAEAAAFVSAEKGVANVDEALAGARDIAAETIAEAAHLRALVRDVWMRDAALVSQRVEAKTKQPTKFEAYYDFRELVSKMPSHRFLAVRRGELEGVLRVHLEVDEARVLPKLENAAGLDPKSPFMAEYRAAIGDGYRRLMQPSIETELRVELKLRSDRLAAEVFAENVKDLLMQPPLGGKSVVGVDPGIRTGCKCVAVDATGKHLGGATIHLKRDAEKAKVELTKFLLEHKPAAIAVGNGTFGRETETFVRALVSELAATTPELATTIVSVVNEAGASVYSASPLAKAELPGMDVTVRGAVSIARRMQDPLAELVKIDPKSIGVGQYQHDVHPPMLVEKLDEVVESCVNSVGVELNTASVPLLSRVAGVGPSLAQKIVRHRDEKGPFASRAQLREVNGLGPKTFEQCAGFLRIRDASEPLDASAVHPERYELVGRMAKDLGVTTKELVGNGALAQRIELARYATGDVGEPTLRDIVAELDRPGRDPRRQFEPPKFRADVTKVEDLRVGMTLEGVVTNVATFGVFVDVGVHQDGLVHVSQLADHFVRDPREVAKVGDKVQVRVLEVDLERKRIALTAKSDAPKNEPRASIGPRGGPAVQPTSDRRPERGERRGGDRRDGRGRRDERGSRDRDETPRPMQKPPPPRPLTPQDAVKQGHNNPLGNLLKDLFKREDAKP
jgi:uncharacterized protein